MASTESKKRLLKKLRLYVIIDKEACVGYSAVSVAKKIKNNGVSIIQFRDKKSGKKNILETAAALRKELLNDKTIFIVNDYIDIAKIIDTDGVHLGQKDVPIEKARKILGKNKIIGISCHTLKQALNAQKRGADYLGVGPLFKTTTKFGITKTIGIDLIKNIQKRIKIPIFAIGGINESNLGQLLNAGVKRIALCSAISKSKNIGVATKRFQQLLS